MEQRDIDKIKLTIYQKGKYNILLASLLQNKDMMDKLEANFSADDILQYVKEGCQFIGEDINADIKVTNEEEEYMEACNILKDGKVMTVRSCPIYTFKDAELNTNMLKKVYTSKCTIPGQEYSSISVGYNKLTSFVFTQINTIFNNGNQSKFVSIVFYIRDNNKEKLLLNTELL